MSVYETPDAFPSGVAAVARHLLACQNCREQSEALKAALSPPNLRSEKGGDRRIGAVIREAELMGLVEKQESGEVELSKRALLAFHGRRFDDAAFCDLMVALLFDPTNEENHDFGCALAWLLTLDPAALCGRPTPLMNLVQQQIGGDCLKFNQTKFFNLGYWSVYLGFARWYRLPDRKKVPGDMGDDEGPGGGRRELLPDPTDYLERALPALFAGAKGRPVPLPVLLERLTGQCPIFAGGWLHGQLRDYQLPPLPPGELHPALSLAWLRLRGRGLLELLNPSDAEGLLLRSGAARLRFSHALWLQPAKGGR